MNINSIGGTSYSGISEVRRTDNLSAGENADIPETAPKKISPLVFISLPRTKTAIPALITTIPKKRINRKNARQTPTRSTVR